MAFVSAVEFCAEAGRDVEGDELGFGSSSRSREEIEDVRLCLLGSSPLTRSLGADCPSLARSACNDLKVSSSFSISCIV